MTPSEGRWNRLNIIFAIIGAIAMGIATIHLFFDVKAPSITNNTNSIHRQSSNDKDNKALICVCKSCVTTD